MSHGADVNALDVNGHSPLWMASAMGNARYVALLLAHGAHVDGAERYDSPLTAAVRNNHVAVVKDLLAAGAHPARGGGGTVSDLRIAATHGAADVIPLLVRAGVPLESTDQFGETPLFYAARVNARTVKALLDAGANPHVANGQGSTPLLEAIRGCDAEIVRLLLAAGGSAPQSIGTATDLAQKCSDVRVLQLLQPGAGRTLEKTRITTRRLGE
jgi:ankyrin repeat protein